jgi:threonine efflux protein
MAMDLRPLAAIAALNLAAAMSPGPAFIFITRTAAGSTRASALNAAAGTVAASVSWAAAALLGVHVVLTQAVGLYRAVQLAGGVYLAVLGMAMWRHAPDALATEVAAASVTGRGAFSKALLLGLSNPKVVVFFGTIFATALSPDTPAARKLAALVIVLCIESTWYGFLALCFGTPPVQRAYRRVKATFERIFGTVLIAFGARLVWSSARADR